MFDIGFWELLLIAGVLLLVIGPDKMPEVARQAAFLLRKARQAMFRIRSEMKTELDGTPMADLQEARREIMDFKNDIKQMGRDMADAHEEKANKKPSTESVVDDVPADKTDKDSGEVK